MDKKTTKHWIYQRITAIALVPLSIWFVTSLLLLMGDEYAAVKHWVKHPLNTAGLALLAGVTFYHAQLGMQVVYEDYIASKTLKTTAIMITKAAFIIMAIIAGLALAQLFFDIGQV